MLNVPYAYEEEELVVEMVIMTAGDGWILPVVSSFVSFRARAREWMRVMIISVMFDGLTIVLA